MQVKMGKQLNDLLNILAIVPRQHPGIKNAWFSKLFLVRKKPD